MFWKGRSTLREGKRRYTPLQELSNTGSTPAKILAIFSPLGMEQYFIETREEDKEPDTTAYIEKAMAVAEKYNLEIVGPPLGKPN